MKRIVPVVLFLSILPSTLGWNETGHRLIAMICYHESSPNQRQAVSELLKHHPMYSRDFRGRWGDVPLDQREKWVFLQSSIWPDLAKRYPWKTARYYNRPIWHYINFPIWLLPSDEDHFNGRPPVNLRANIRWWTTRWNRKLNVIQAMKLNVRSLNDKKTSRSAKAIHLCWLFHLVGDVHQPLHSTAVFSEGLKFESGDQGGNAVKIPSGSLHGFWDGTLGYDKDLLQLERKVRELLDANSGETKGKAAASDLNFESWANESHTIAKEVVYADFILDHMRQYRSYPANQNLPKITLPDTYQTKAKDVSNIRAIEAGFRLAAILKQLSL